LSKVNSELAEENARLRNLVQNNYLNEVTSDSIFATISDSVGNYNFTSAKIIQTSVNKQLNYITLNKGAKHGVQPDQAIISTQGIVGVVTNVSKNYAMGLSVLNKRWSISAKLKKSGFYGSLVWDGIDFRYATLTEIPFHIELQHGDTVVTSGYSSIFPEGIMVGTIQSFNEPEGENYYQIQIKLSTNFKSVTYVDIVENRAKSELEQLKQQTLDDQGNY
jgi:rod shape-determining protein MreC